MAIFTLKQKLMWGSTIFFKKMRCISLVFIFSSTSLWLQAQTSLSLTEIHTNVTCHGGNTGSVTISASGGTSPYAGTGTFSNLTAGEYSYTVTDSQGSSKQISVIITEPEAIIATATVTQPKCYGENGKVEISLTGPVENSCNWSGGFSSGNLFIPISSNIFSNRTDFTAGSAPQGLAAGDLDGDGKKDLVVSNYLGGTISVFKNTTPTGATGYVSFADRVNFSIGGSPFGVSIDDIDGDGKKDILVANSSTHTISIFRNISSAGSLDSSSFAAGVDFATPNTPLFVEVADLDGDGKKEMVVSSTNYGSFVTVYRNTSVSGNITVTSFDPGVSFETNFNPHGIALEDIDGDGKRDIAVTNYGENSVSIFRNRSAIGTITESSFEQKIDFTTGADPFTISIVDLDADGKKDMVVACPGDNTISLLKNSSTPGSILFNEKLDLVTGNFPLYVSVADMDGDLKKDIVVTTTADNTFSFFKNVTLPGAIDQNSFNTKVEILAGDNPRGLAIDDFDNNGSNDVATANNVNNSISVFLKSNSNCSSTTSHTLSAGSPYSYIVTDMNGCSSNMITGLINAPRELQVNAIVIPSSCSEESTVLIAATGGTPPYSGIGTFKRREGPYVFGVTDANGCFNYTEVYVDPPSITSTLTANCSNSNPVLYFGYAQDQSTTISVQPSGGVEPYNIEVTMNRPLNCNVINNSGDEIWMPGANTYFNSFTSCPSTGVISNNPVSKATITASQSYSVSLTLMQDADITVTVTDANGCTYQCTSHVHAEDVRCFAGNSNNQKITLCHKTGSTTNPCVTICVDQSAVAEHLAHGDFVGKCTPNCIAPVGKQSINASPASVDELNVMVTPNPTMNYFNVNVIGKNDQPVTIKVMDIYGRTLQVEQKMAANSTVRLGQKWTAGTYLVEVFQGEERRIVKVVKAN